VRADPLPDGGAATLRDARFSCQKGAPGRRSDECERCERFSGWHIDQGEHLCVSCQWSARDPVSARMTVAAGLVTVAPEIRCRDADALARERGIHHLPVILEGRLVGIVTRSDFYPPPQPDEPVSERMGRDILIVGEDATLGEALAAMNLFKVGCLPVVKDGILVGILTRRDLRSIGVVDVALETGACWSCGGAHGLRRHARHTDVQSCLGCLQRASDEFAALELGEAE
jgi:CBS domain-containing protein